MLNDPAMKEIIDGFCEESLGFYTELEEALETLEDDPATYAVELEKFGQIIDRVMGAAKSVGADEVASFSELGKVIGYKSSQVKDMAIVNVVIAILFDCVDLLRKMTQGIKAGNDHALKGLNTKAFCTRLKWLSDKFKDIERASCAMEKKDPEEVKELDQNSIDDLMASLGL
jgi:chemotaxis protein histidine kinase CheA